MDKPDLRKSWIVYTDNRDNSIDYESITEDMIADDAVTTEKIKNTAVTTEKIADYAVTDDELAANAVTTAKIADTAVTTAKIDNTAVTTAKMADAAVTTAKLDDSAVTTAKIADEAVTEQKLKTPISIDSGGTGQTTASDALNALLENSPLPISKGGTGANTSSDAISNLGALPTSGGVLSGGLIVTGGNEVTLKSGDIDRGGELPAQSQYNPNLYFSDVNNNALGFIRSYRETTGESGIQIYGYGEDSGGTAIANSIRLGVRPDGTKRTAIDAESWLSALEIGTVTEKDQSTSTSVPNGVFTNITSFVLGKGKWIVTAHAHFSNNSTGRRFILLSTTSQSQDATDIRKSAVSQMAVNGAETRIETQRVFTLSANTTVYLVGFQSSGSALSATAYVSAVKVG